MAAETVTATETASSTSVPRGDVIVVEDLWKTYDMGSEQQVHALRGVSLRIQHNEYVAIMGPSGSGKSTLMNLIGCLDSPSQGTYTLNGHRVSDLNDDQLARIRNREIGFVFQTFNLLPRSTALDNVALPLVYAGVGKAERRERAEEALAAVELKNRMSHKPNELSGGQRQRVAIARALVSRPKLVLADEPTANLDSVTGQNIIDLMKSMNQQKGTTFIFSTHDHRVMRHADAVVRLADGKLEGRESAEQAVVSTLAVASAPAAASHG